MSFAGFCEKCGVPYYEGDALLHQHTVAPPSVSVETSANRPPKQRDADLIIPLTPPPIGTKEPTSEQAETLGSELWEQWFCRSMSGKETWMKHVMPILRKYFPVKPEAAPLSGEGGERSPLIYGDKESWCGSYTRNGESNSGGNLGHWYSTAVYWRNKAEGVLNPGELCPKKDGGTLPSPAPPNVVVHEMHIEGGDSCYDIFVNGEWVFNALSSVIAEKVAHYLINALQSGPSLPSEALCGEVVQHLIAGASWFTCALLKGHKEKGHRAAGNCIKHGAYLGEPHAVPQCPKWPDCINGAVLTSVAAPSDTGREQPVVEPLENDLKKFTEEYAALNNKPVPARPKYDPYVEGAYDFAAWLEVNRPDLFLRASDPQKGQVAPKRKMRASPLDDIHDECPDCRGTCSPVEQPESGPSLPSEGTPLEQIINNLGYNWRGLRLEDESTLEYFVKKVLAAAGRCGPQKGQGWVSVEERYPEWKLRVLAFDGKRQLVDYLMDVTNKRWHSGWNMTHWRELPSSPSPSSREGE